jgi:hypothetical protein
VLHSGLLLSLLVCSHLDSTMDNFKVKLQLWDTAGQERFVRLAIFFLVFDNMTWPSSF